MSPFNNIKDEMNREEAAHKVRHLQKLAHATQFPHETATAEQIAQAIITRYELTPEEVKFSPKKQSVTMVDKRLRGLLDKLIKTKLWLVYAGKVDGLGTQVAVLQIEMERIIEEWERTRKAGKKTTRPHTHQPINDLRRRYL